MKSPFGTSYKTSNIPREEKGEALQKQSKRKIEKLGAVKRKGKLKKTGMDKIILKQTAIDKWAIKTSI